MSEPIAVRVDPTNPGQFFACCGLLELSDRLWGGAAGWFSGGQFFILPRETGEATGLAGLVRAASGAPIRQTDLEDDTSSPIDLGPPFSLRLDWWADTRSGGKGMKVWAGRMDSVRIARAMQCALRKPGFGEVGLLDVAALVFDQDEPSKKVEPFYFDSRRAANAHSIDLGFAPDPLGMTAAAFPATEFFCLVGLQRVRPRPTGELRAFEFYTWSEPADARLASVAAVGLVAGRGRIGYRFESGFRTSQRKHKAFMPAVPISRRSR